SAVIARGRRFGQRNMRVLMVNKVNPEGWLAWVLKRIEDHPANRINDLMPWAFQDVINAQNAEAEAKDAA
ncbi:MAG: transposase domain-containing protein, partial [Rhodobacteraceae bacterium]|nr:transposase domain-containing protein [Paracoccaceae bacterium]